MLMETDANYSEVYIKISKNYQLKSSDSVLTELGYDDINRLETPVANCLLQTFIRSYGKNRWIEYRQIPKDIIEEALNLRLSDEVYNSVSNSTNTSETIQTTTDPTQSEASGLNAIMSAAQRLESASSKDGSGSLVLPSVTSDLPPESLPI